MIKFDITKDDAFKVGNTPTLEQVLVHRENRVRYIESLAKQYHDSVIVSYKCNIPGSIKNNEVIAYIFSAGKEDLLDCMTRNYWSAVFEKEVNVNTGIEYFAVLSGIDAVTVKEAMIEIESQNGLARLYDFDVFFVEGKQLKSVTRQVLNIEPRKCFLCEQDAKLCGRSRTHSVEELHEKMIELLIERGVCFNG